MLNPSTQSQPGNPLLSKSNGVENEAPLNPSNRKYFVEDFSQQAINRGQVEINFLLTVVNERIRMALKQLETAVQKLANNEEVDLKSLKDSIEAVHEANQKVAGPFPPGCNPALVDRPNPD